MCELIRTHNLWWSAAPVRPSLTPLRLGRRVRKQVKRSVERAGLEFAASSCAGAVMFSSSDDEHNTSNTLLSSCAHALVARVLLWPHGARRARNWQNDVEEEPSEAARLLHQCPSSTSS